MKRMFAILLALMLFSVVPQFTGANDDTGWSLPVNGLGARLSFGKKETINGTPLISTYLELRNVADRGLASDGLGSNSTCLVNRTSRPCQILFEDTTPFTPKSGLPCSSLTSASTTTARS